MKKRLHLQLKLFLVELHVHETLGEHPTKLLCFVCLMFLFYGFVCLFFLQHVLHNVQFMFMLVYVCYCLYVCYVCCCLFNALSLFFFSLSYHFCDLKFEKHQRMEFVSLKAILLGKEFGDAIFRPIEENQRKFQFYIYLFSFFLFLSLVSYFKTGI